MRTVITVLLFSFFTVVLPVSAYEVKTTSKVIAFADVHGAYDDWVSLLQ
jgi:hypothetical protein